MYRSLEPHRGSAGNPVSREAKSPQADCICVCKKELENQEDKAPASDLKALEAAVYYDING